MFAIQVNCCYGEHLLMFLQEGSIFPSPPTTVLLSVTTHSHNTRLKFHTELLILAPWIQASLKKHPSGSDTGFLFDNLTPTPGPSSGDSNCSAHFKALSFGPPLVLTTHPDLSVLFWATKPLHFCTKPYKSCRREGAYIYTSISL